MKGTKHYRRYFAATIAALGVGAGFAASANAVTLTNFDIPPAADSQPLGITAGPDGNIWFADPGAQNIGRLSAAGVLQQLPTAAFGGGPAGITVGPDGNLWYTKFDGNVEKITPAGTASPEELLDGAANLQGIATGPDSNLWVAEKGGDRLWRVAPGGAETAFGAAGTALSAQSVARGPAGDTNIYVTTTGGVMRADTSGAAAAPALFSATPSAAYGIALGPDGNFWVTHAGGVSHFSAATGGALAGGVALPGADVRGITVGPDGALWFAETATDRVGRLTTGGVFSDFAVPGCDAPEGIAAGPGNTVYVTCFGQPAGPMGVPPEVPGHTVVRITLDAVAPPPAPGPGPGPAPGPGVTPTVANLKGLFSFNKTKVFAGKAFTVNVTFNKLVTKSRVRVQIKSVNTKPRGAIKTFKTITSKLVTGKKAALRVKIGKPGAFLLRITYKNGARTINVKAVKVTVKKAVVKKN